MVTNGAKTSHTPCIQSDNCGTWLKIFGVSYGCSLLLCFCFCFRLRFREYLREIARTIIGNEELLQIVEDYAGAGPGPLSGASGTAGGHARARQQQAAL